jgi:hypothetical protein
MPLARMDFVTVGIATEQGQCFLGRQVGFETKSPVDVIAAIAAGFRFPAQTATEPMILELFLDDHTRFPAPGTMDGIAFVKSFHA